MSEVDIPRYSRVIGGTDTLFSSNDDIVHKQQQTSLSPVGSPVERRLNQSAPVHNQSYSLFFSNPVSSVLHPDTEIPQNNAKAIVDDDLQFSSFSMAGNSWEDDYFGLDGLDLTEPKRTNTVPPSNNATEGQPILKQQIPPLLKSLSADNPLSFLSVGIGVLSNSGSDADMTWLPSFKSLPNLPSSNTGQAISLSSPSSPSNSSSSSSLSSSPVISPVLPSLTFTHPASIDNNNSGTKFGGGPYLSTASSPRQLTNSSINTNFHTRHTQLAATAPFQVSTSTSVPLNATPGLSSSYSPSSPSKSPTRPRTHSPQSLPHSHPSLLQTSQSTGSPSGTPNSPGRRTNYSGSRGGSSQQTNCPVVSGGNRNKSPLRRGSPLRSSPPLSPRRIGNQSDSTSLPNHRYQLSNSGLNDHNNSSAKRNSSDDSDSEAEGNERTIVQYGKHNSLVSPNGTLPSTNGATLSSSPTLAPLSSSPSIPPTALGSVNWPSLGASSAPTNSHSVNTSKAQHTSSFDLNLERVRSGYDKRATLMIKNIPNKYNQDMILETFHNHGFSGSFDFFYLPIDFKNKCNVGYAFINFIEAATVASFYVAFNHTKWEKFNSEKICTITYARIQGKHALIDHFRNSSLMYEDPACRPLIFHSSGPSVGTLEPFPIAANSLNGSRNQRVPPGKPIPGKANTLFNQQGTL